jgi:nicotinamide mononucleotide adenylyltransferase
MSNICPVGSVHGRFQPFHKQHLEYLLEAKARCQFMWIGITQYNILKLFSCPDNIHRALPKHNPLTYFERIEIISNCLKNENIPSNEFAFIPFPIEEDDYLTNFLPLHIPIFTTICDQWNEQKINKLSKIGYEVTILYKRKKHIIRGNDIRKKVLSLDSEYRHLITDSTYKYLKKISLRDRLVELHNKNEK